MEKELTELFERAKKAADESENSPAEESRCLDALEELKKFPVNLEVLMATKVGQHVRQLKKHKSNKIKLLAAEVVDLWKNVLFHETVNKKKNGTTGNSISAKSEEGNNIQSPRSVKSEQRSTTVKTVKVEKTTQSSTPKPAKAIKSETSSSIKIEKSEVIQTTKNASGEHLHVEKKVKLEKSTSEIQKPTSAPVAPPKLSSLVYCKDPARDKLREVIAEALCKVSNETNDDELKAKISSCDPYRVAVMVETALYERLGKSTGPHKQKYRSLMFNLKDIKNPDFRRRVLIGEFEPTSIVDLSPEDMASDSRREENLKLQEKAMFNAERAAAPKATTNEFTCGRCRKKETTYHQMQTRSADEPMTTYVQCVNCGYNWKFC